MLAILGNAEVTGAITLEWGRDAASRDLKRIRLRDADRLADWLGESRAAALVAKIDRQARPWLTDVPDWLSTAFDDALADWRLGKVAHRTPPDDTSSAVRLFRIAAAVAAGEQKALDLRRFSVQLLGDSKAVERLLGRLAGLLRRNPDWAPLEDDAELFQAIGLTKFPPPVFVKGPLRLRYGSGDLGACDWDLSPLRPFVAVAPDAVSNLEVVSPAPYMLTIENLASFQRHVREVQDEGVVVYTASFPAPSLVSLIGRLDEVLSADCPFFHWGDRDPSGLRIFAAVARACSRHPLRPHLMDVPEAEPRQFTAEERRALRQTEGTDGAGVELARYWLVRRLGRLEQEAIDPLAPGDRHDWSAYADRP